MTKPLLVLNSFIFLFCFFIVACESNQTGENNPNGDIKAKQDDPVVFSAINVPAAILYCDSVAFNRIVCIKNRPHPCSKCLPDDTVTNNNWNNAAKGNMIMKFVIDSNRFSMHGWMYLKAPNRDFNPGPDLEFKVSETVANVAFSSKDYLGDFILGRRQVEKIWCLYNNRFKYILAIPFRDTRQSPAIISWKFGLTNEDPGVLPLTNISYIDVDDLDMNPIPPGGFNRN